MKSKLLSNNITQDIRYTSIQDAIGDASSGDEVVVYPGTYYEQIDFDGKSITVRSVDPNDWDIVKSTIIDANGLYDHVVRFDSGEDANSILSGLTLTGGYAVGSGPENSGGGFYCYSASPTRSKTV